MNDEWIAKLFLDKLSCEDNFWILIDNHPNYPQIKEKTKKAESLFVNYLNSINIKDNDNSSIVQELSQDSDISKKIKRAEIELSDFLTYLETEAETIAFEVGFDLASYLYSKKTYHNVINLKILKKIIESDF